MPVAAVPKYLGDSFKDASPASRFGMFLKLWQKVDWSKETDSVSASKEAAAINPADRKMLDAFGKRQKAVFANLSEESQLQLIARSDSPFATGLGNEHPLENGFSFLNPYGLPYLPGSGVKGVVRRAAEELAGIAPSVTWAAQSEDGVWTQEAINTLFGPDSSDAGHGALSFWDVLPEISGGRLAIEVMTPHYSHYYQGSASPHDSGQPIPINFMTVPPGSNFTFHVVCDRKRLTTDLAENDRWKTLLESAFEHAFEWCGFGAKTAVGYGAMQRDTGQEAEIKRRHQERQQREMQERQRAERLAAMSPIEREIQEVLEARTDKNMTEIAAIIQAVKDELWRGQDKITVAEELKARMQKAKQWRETSAKKRPAKDKDHQNTLRVMAWLTGQ